MNTVKRTFEENLAVAQEILRYLMLGVAFFSLLALATGDIWIGAGSISSIAMNESIGWAISFMTTGALLALWIIPAYGVMRGWVWWKIVIVTFPAFLLYLIDAFFDMRYADVIIYGQYMPTGQLPEMEKVTLTMMRILMVVCSSLGDVITAVAIAGLTVLTWLLTGKKPEFQLASSNARPAAASPLAVDSDQSGVPEGFVRVVMPGGASKIFRRGS